MVFGLSLSWASLWAADWPGWQGPSRDNKSPDRGLLKAWPEAGPKLLWQADGIGSGFSSPAVVGRGVYIAGAKGGRLSLFAFDLEGKPRWKTEHGVEHASPGGSSPVVDGRNLYILSADGLIGCYDTDKGERRWTREMKEFGGATPGWGYSESVLIYKDLAVVTPGGKNCMVALNKGTGETVWKSTGVDMPAHHSSAIAVSYQGVPMIINGSGGGIFAVSAKDGLCLWSNPAMANNTASCPTPAFSDGYVFWANGYGRGGICFKLSADKGQVQAHEAWKTKDMDCHHGGYVLLDGYIYGNHNGGWNCLELKTGEKKWSAPGVGKGSICYADDMFYLFSENQGLMGLAHASPQGMELKSKFNVKGKDNSWAHPVVIGGRLYLRYDDHLYCFDVKG